MKPKLSRAVAVSGGETDDNEDNDRTDRTPLVSSPFGGRPRSGTNRGYGGFDAFAGSRHNSQPRRQSIASSRSSRKRRGLQIELGTSANSHPDYDVNNPPSVPSSPKGLEYNDVMLTEDVEHDSSSEHRGRGDAVIEIYSSSDGSASPHKDRQRRHTIHPAEADVCFPHDGISELGSGEHRPDSVRSRRRRKKWPEFQVLEEWAQEEKKELALEELRMRKVSEPVMVGGRLRPMNRGWHRSSESDPSYRFTYFNENFENTIHSETISGLVQDGVSFHDLFHPDPPEIDESSAESDEEGTFPSPKRPDRSATPTSGEAGARARANTRQSSVLGERGREREQDKQASSGMETGVNTPTHGRSPSKKPKRYGPRPVFWLDVRQPTVAEMNVLSKAFGIHPLSREDILSQEAREKVELFKNYYLVNFRSFQQDKTEDDYMEPIDIYILVFKEGVLSFHFSETPHPANVRRRIRQLQDFILLDSQWICYGIIDDITDAYVPLIKTIEDEVDDIDDAILRLHSSDEASIAPKPKKPKSKTKARLLSCIPFLGGPAKDGYLEVSQEEYNDDKKSETNDPTSGDSGGDMLRRVGECRKKVMELYRLLGNKADVIKGLAKRCNEEWQIAPRSEIGMYLGDIQDHIVTMTGNLSHYESYVLKSPYYARNVG